MDSVAREELERMWRLGWSKLGELRTPLGYNASESGSGLFAALFGRDSLWIILFLLSIATHRSSFAEEVHDVSGNILATLAGLQGKHETDLIEEQPGKIIHQHWVTEPTPPRVHTLPFVDGSSYCGFDQTFLFITAVRRFLDLFPDTPFEKILLKAVRAAVEWLSTYGRDHKFDLFAYQRRYPGNPVHQVWKDSFDSITQVGFDIPVPPVAWIEVQAYAYRALLDAAELYRRAEAEQQLTEHLTADAAALRKRVDERFWLQDEGCYAVAVDGDGVPVRMVTSNCGHALWAGMPDRKRASEIGQRLIAADMLTGYGLRTLSAADRFFAPHAYHRGPVWPFDNAVIAWGMLQYGLEREARAVMTGVLRGLALVGSPIELYVVIPSTSLIEPAPSGVSCTELLLNRRVPPENVNQGWTAAGLLFCVDALARMDDVPLS